MKAETVKTLFCIIACVMVLFLKLTEDVITTSDGIVIGLWVANLVIWVITFFREIND